MQVIENGVSRILIPEKGYKLVNKNTGNQMMKVYMGKLDSVDNYTEIVDEKYVNMDYVVELDDLKEDYNKNKEKNNMSIDLILSTIDELYTLFEVLLKSINEPMAMSMFNEILKQPISNLALMYVEMVKRGLKDKDEIPERFKEEVNNILNKR
jgi:hypothetical protein